MFLKVLFYFVLFMLILPWTILNLSFPVIVGLLVVFYTYVQEDYVFVIAFLIGLLQDSLLLQMTGMTSAFLLCFLLLIRLYEKKFEISTNWFVGIATFIGTFIYLCIYAQNYVVATSVVNALCAVILYKILPKKKEKKVIGNMQIL